MDERLSAVQALSRVMADVQAVRKGDRNTEQNYSFRGIDAVMNAVGPALRQHRVVPIPHKVDVSHRDVRISRDKPARECTLVVTYRFYGPSGDFVEAEAPGESMDSGDKGTPKAMSVAYRTCLLQLLCIPTDEQDPDGDSYERAEQSEPDPVSVLRAQIWHAAKAVGLQSREAIEVDCKDTTGWDITQADQGQLESYLAGLKARAEKPPADDPWYVRTEAEVAKPAIDDPIKALKLEVWQAAQQAGLGTKENLEQDFAMSTGGLILGEANEGELRSYLGLLQSRLDEVGAEEPT